MTSRTLRQRSARMLLVGVATATVAAMAAVGASRGGGAATSVTGRATVKVIRTYPHDTTAFTEGLEVRGTTVYESSGLYGKSSLRVSNLKTGKVVKTVPLDAPFFGEGMTILPGNRIVQFTWKEGTAIVRDLTTLAEVNRFSYAEEGWGLCWSASKKAIVHSDGTNVLRLRDPDTFEVVRSVATKFRDGRAPTALNELECVDGTVYVNVWTTKTILQVDLATGEVMRTIDASALGPTTVASADDVMNGIARLPNGNFLLTGKRWPTSYEVTFVNTK